MKNDSLLFYRIVRDFLTIYLPKQRGASQNTAKSYRDTLKTDPWYKLVLWPWLLLIIS